MRPANEVRLTGRTATSIFGEVEGCFNHYISPMVDEQYSEPAACQAEKNIHDICFFNWYQEEFLKGSDKSLDVCKEQWDTYQRCLQVGYLPLLFSTILLIE